jgi:hypothetical protein
VVRDLDAVDVLSSRARRFVTAIRRRLGGRQIALIAVLGVGTGLRLWMMHQIRPAVVGYPDAVGYIAAAERPGGLLFYNPWRPAGYPLFLRALHDIHVGLAFVIDVQHLMGLVVAVLLYLMVSRFTKHKWVAVIPAAIVALSGSELFLEHSPLTETLYTLLTVGGLYCTVRAFDARGWRMAVWLFAAGVLVGAAVPVRTIGFAVIPVFIVWAAITQTSWRRGAGCAAVVVIGSAVALGSYLGYQHSVTGTWAITRSTGENLYARSALFANCRDFTPPTGTRDLCQSSQTPRQGATFYMYDPSSPLLQSVGPPPDPSTGGGYTWPYDSKLAAFGLDAIEHQPFAFLSTTVQGLVKYVDPSLGTPTMLELDHDALIDTLLQGPGGGAGVISLYYPGHPTIDHGVGGIEAYAKAAKVEGPVTALLMLLMVAGWFATRGRQRTVAGLFGWTTLAMMVTPVALLVYGARYATPAYGPLAAAAAVGLDGVIDLVFGQCLAVATTGRSVAGRWGRITHRGWRAA